MNELVMGAAKDLQLRSLDATALQKISEGMMEQARISAVFGKRNSQTTLKLMTLTMNSAAPYRALRQCASEIERRKNAFLENMISLKRARVEAQKFRRLAKEETDPEQRQLFQIDAEEREQRLEMSKTYVEGALRDIASLQDAYEQIKKQHGIRDNWDEKDFERGEIEHHIKSVFRLAYRDLVHTGRMSSAACEYAEQFGIHPQTVRQRAHQYAMQCDGMFGENQAPSIDHYHQWLHACYEAHKEDVHKAVKHLGLVDLITKWSLYVEEEPSPSS